MTRPARLAFVWLLLVVGGAVVLVTLSPTPTESVNAATAVIFTFLGAVIVRK